MLKILSFMSCTSKIHPFSLGNYLGTSLVIGNYLKNSTDVDDVAPPTVKLSEC